MSAPPVRSRSDSHRREDVPRRKLRPATRRVHRKSNLVADPFGRSGAPEGGSRCAIARILRGHRRGDLPMHRRGGRSRRRQPLERAGRSRTRPCSRSGTDRRDSVRVAVRVRSLSCVVDWVRFSLPRSPTRGPSALREAVEAAATTHDIEIEPLPPDEDDADRPCGVLKLEDSTEDSTERACATSAAHMAQVTMRVCAARVRS
jgi:hypothetical protein